MDLSYKQIAIGSAGVILVSFAAGRYTARTPDIKEKITAETQDNKQTNKDTKKKTVIEKDPSGKTTTVITEETVTKVNDKKNTQESLAISEKSKGPVVNISGLLGYDLSSHPTPIYGASISKEFIGPVTVGAFGLTNGTIGVSIGVNF